MNFDPVDAAERSILGLLNGFVRKNGKHRLSMNQNGDVATITIGRRIGFQVVFKANGKFCKTTRCTAEFLLNHENKSPFSPGFDKRYNAVCASYVGADEIVERELALFLEEIPKFIETLEKRPF